MFHLGARIDRYRLVAELGAGGQAAVFRAEDALNPDVPRVVKLFSTRGATPASVERLRREARLLASLDHPSLVKCSGLFEDLELGALGLVLEYVEGVTLKAAMESPRWSARLADSALRHIAACLAYVHGQRYVHRDLKAENVLLDVRFFEHPGDPRGVRVIDLGIAVDELNAEHLTQTGTVIGTSAYMAPEVIAPTRFQGSRSAPTVDVFAFGVIAWELLVGGHPTGVGEWASLGDFGAAYVRLAHEAGWGWAPAPEPWRSVIRACLAVESRDRPRDGSALVAMLVVGPGQTRSTELHTVMQEPLFLTTPPSDGMERASAAPLAPGKRASDPPRGRLVLGGMGLLAVGLLGGWCLARSPSEPAEEEASAAEPTPTAALESPIPRPSSGPLALSPDPPVVSAGFPWPAAPGTLMDPRGPSSDTPCSYVTDGSGLNAQGDVDTSLEWAFARADLRENGHSLTGVGGRWGLWSYREYLGPMGTPDLSIVPRIVPTELRELVNPLLIAQEKGQVVYRCYPKLHDRWGAKALTRGICIPCTGDDDQEYQLCSCLADPRAPRPGKNGLSKAP